MSAQPRRAPVMTLRELVGLYRALAQGYGKNVPLSAFQLSPREIEAIFSGYDEDYHISRFFHFSEADGEKYSINGISASQVAIDGEILTIL